MSGRRGSMSFVFEMAGVCGGGEAGGGPKDWVSGK